MEFAVSFALSSAGDKNGPNVSPVPLMTMLRPIVLSLPCKTLPNQFIRGIRFDLQKDWKIFTQDTENAPAVPYSDRHGSR